MQDSVAGAGKKRSWSGSAPQVTPRPPRRLEMQQLCFFYIIYAAEVLPTPSGVCDVLFLIWVNSKSSPSHSQTRCGTWSQLLEIAPIFGFSRFFINFTKLVQWTQTFFEAYFGTTLGHLMVLWGFESHSTTTHNFSLTNRSGSWAIFSKILWFGDSF